MKCIECKEEIEGEYASVKNGENRLDNIIDYGGDAENIQPSPDKNYYHRECLKKRIIRRN